MLCHIFRERRSDRFRSLSGIKMFLSRCGGGRGFGLATGAVPADSLLHLSPQEGEKAGRAGHAIVARTGSEMPVTSPPRHGVSGANEHRHQHQPVCGGPLLRGGRVAISFLQRLEAVIPPPPPQCDGILVCLCGVFLRQVCTRITEKGTACSHCRPASQFRHPWRSGNNRAPVEAIHRRPQPDG